jgi:starvation-inducible DNA-binding protein
MSSKKGSYTKADTMTLRDLDKKHHWQVAGPTFYQLHLLFDKHYDEQNDLVDTIAERIQLLGASASPWLTTSPRRRRR